MHLHKIFYALIQKAPADEIYKKHTLNIDFDDAAQPYQDLVTERLRINAQAERNSQNTMQLSSVPQTRVLEE